LTTLEGLETIWSLKTYTMKGKIMFTNVRTNILLAFAAACTLSACQTMPYQPYARDVKKRPQQGGVIALKTEHRDEDMAKAQQMMASNCATLPVKVLEEGEVAVGQETKSSSSTTNNQGTEGHQVGTLFGLPITSGGTQASKDTAGTATTTSIKEWQISYECTQPVATGKSSKR
jgi:hypothetical protein